MLLLLLLAGGLLADDTVQDFDKPDEGTPYVISQKDSKPGPVVENGAMTLLNGYRSRGPLSNAVAFARTATGAHDIVEAEFEFVMRKGAHGAAFALLNTKHFGVAGEVEDPAAWEEPNFKESFAVGIDTYNPPTTRMFDKQGNFYGRPQREVSLHWDGRELARVVSPVEFRDEKPHRLRLELLFEAGGAVVTLAIDATRLYEDRFFAGPVAYESRAVFGGRTGTTSTHLVIDDVKVKWSEPAQFNPSRRVRTFDGVLMFGKQRRFEQEFELPSAAVRAERVILTLTLAPGPGGWDEWDVGAAIYAWEGDERYEILRYVTPYKRAWTWKVDVTDHQSILRGKRKLGLKVDSWKGKSDPQKGFEITVDLDYFQGAPAVVPFRVVNLVNRSYRFGNEQAKIDEAFPEIRTLIPEGTKGAKLRFMVTGHGQWGEFTAAERTASFNDKSFKNTLWKTDVYLNPVRPQSGTWKFDRAGWAPGDIVTPWEIDVTGLIEPGKEARIRYRPLAWPDPGQKIQASHWVEAQLILYR